MPLAYEAWMYADGPGGNNIDCLTAGDSGCWGHRHNILSPFAGGGPLAMGAAAGRGSDGTPGYAVLLVQGAADYRPVYLYTWSEAVAAGADGGASTGAAPRAARAARLSIRITLLRVRGHSLTLRLLNPAGVRVSCALTRLTGRSRLTRYRRCAAGTTYRRLRAGGYRLRVQGGGRRLTRYVLV